MATPKSSIKSTRPSSSYNEEPAVEDCSESPLAVIYSNSIYQNQRLVELNHMIEELVNYLGLGGPSDGSAKLTSAPYGRLEEIKETQNNVFQNINELEQYVYTLRRALM